MVNGISGTMKLIATAICAASSIACTSAHPFPCELTVDTSFTDHEVELIASAADEWEIATGGIAHVEMTIEAQQPLKHIIKRVDAEEDIRTSPSDSIGYGDIPHETLIPGLHRTAISAEIYPQRIKHVIASGVYGSTVSYDDLFRQVVLHELGHHFGLDHDSNENSLMFPFAETFCITTIDIAQFCSIHGCDDAPKNIGSRCGTSWESEN